MNLLTINRPCKLSAQQGRLVVNYQDAATNDCEDWLCLSDFSLVVIETLQCTLTTSALLLANKQKVAIVICDKKQQPSVFCYGLYDYYQLTTAINQQIGWLSQPDKKCQLQQQITKCKLIHQADLLNHISPQSASTAILKDYLTKIDNADNKQMIEQYEALFARHYFPIVFGRDFTRFAKDYPNHLLNYAYAILRAKIKTRIIDAGLHPAISIWHHNQFNNFNLADDIIEIFRPMADYLVYQILTTAATTEICKEDKHRCQLLVLQSVDWAGYKAGFDYALKNYIQSIINCFKTAQPLEIPKLNISYYDFRLVDEKLIIED